MSGWTGIDLSEFELDAPFEHRESQAIQSAVEAMSLADPGHVWSIREIAEWGTIGGLSPVSVGSPVEVADALQEWVADTGIDGFNLSYAVMDAGFRDFVDLVVPELQQRGLFRHDYEGETLRDHLGLKRPERLP